MHAVNSSLPSCPLVQSTSLLGHSAELLRIIRKSPQPADLLTSSYMRDRKYIGASDRRAISAVVFHAQRVLESADELWRRTITSCQALHRDSERNQDRDVAFENENESKNDNKNKNNNDNTPDSSASISHILSAIPIDVGCISVAVVLCEQWNAVGALQPFLRTVPPEVPSNAHWHPWQRAVTNFLCEKYQLNPTLCSEICDAIQYQFAQLATHDTPADIALHACLPEWMVHERLHQGGTTASYAGNHVNDDNVTANHSGADHSIANHVREFGVSFIQPAPLCLRVNTRVATREQVLRALRNENIECSPGRLSPQGIIVHERVRLADHALMNSGAIEVQDEGSQMVGFACNPQPKQRILDACSGAGGKALHLAVLQDDQGEIMASDAEPKRMRELNTRMRTANLYSIRVQALLHLDESSRSRLEGSFDIVLVDAPCSGLGTIRRTPMLKWRTSEAAIERLHEKQTRIIQEYARFVKRDGVLVYVTCSVIRRENEDVVQSFLARHADFVPDPLLPHFTAHGCTVPGCGEHDFMLRLDPLHSGTDGFFLARMKRAAHDTSLTSENS